MKDLTVKTEKCITDLKSFELGLLEVLQMHGLPTEGILVPVEERGRFFHNIGYTLNLLDQKKIQNSTYISKFLAAVSSGLFDAALNYLWNETINDLREKVKGYNLRYFYDTLGLTENRRKDLKTPEDLVKITDEELIKGCKNIELLSSLGYKEIDHIRYMRNWSSAAHPNNADITAIKLLNYFETCLKEVISIETPKVAVEINKLLSDIKTIHITDESIKSSVEYLKNLPQTQLENLTNGLFGIYIEPSTPQSGIDNISKILKSLYIFINDDIKYELGLRYAGFKINNFQIEEERSRDFLKLIAAESYIPEDLKIVEIQISLENLKNAHSSNNNFYSEPVFAKQLKSLVGDFGEIPIQIKHEYVYTLINVFLTNGNGIAWNAELIYKQLINKFDNSMVLIALTSYKKDEISNKLRYQPCRNKFRELINMIESKIIDTSVKDFAKTIRYDTNLQGIADNPKISSRVRDLKILLK